MRARLRRSGIGVARIRHRRRPCRRRPAARARGARGRDLSCAAASAAASPPPPPPPPLASAAATAAASRADASIAAATVSPRPPALLDRWCRPTSTPASTAAAAVEERLLRRTDQKSPLVIVLRAPHELADARPPRWRCRRGCANAASPRSVTARLGHAARALRRRGSSSVGSLSPPVHRSARPSPPRARGTRASLFQRVAVAGGVVTDAAKPIEQVAAREHARKDRPGHWRRKPHRCRRARARARQRGQRHSRLAGKSLDRRHSRGMDAPA